MAIAEPQDLLVGFDASLPTPQGDAAGKLLAADDLSAMFGLDLSGA